ncbi:hypothetical protein U1Q18_052326, partial [Sarracenia purpurea var. burkii]
PYSSMYDVYKPGLFIIAPYDVYKWGTIFRLDYVQAVLHAPYDAYKRAPFFAWTMFKPCCLPRTMLTNGHYLSLHDVQAVLLGPCDVYKWALL